MPDDLVEKIPSQLRPVLRKGAAASVRLLGSAGVPRMAKGKRDTAALDLLEQRLGHTADFSRSYTVEEPVPSVKLAYASNDAIRPRPISTFNLVVDTTHPGYSFQKNMLVDHLGYVLTEERLPWDVLVASRSRLERPRRVRGTVAYLSNTDVANFAHWMCLTVPLVGIYRERLGIEPDYYYIGQPLRDHHLETLALLGVEPDRILTDPVCADRLVAVLANRRWGAFDSQFLRFTRDRVGGGGPAEPPTRRLLIGRGSVKFRYFLNEDECFALLRDRYGFEHVTMDGLTVPQEVALWQSASCVIAVCGAALTNLLWASEDVRVMELMSFDWNHPFFMEMAAFLGCEYAYVIGKDPAAVAAGPSGREGNLRRRSDVLIDVDELERAVQALGIAPV